MLQEEIAGFSGGQAPVTSASPSVVSSPDAFDCCSRFRECSDAKACLISALEYSKGCTYRNRLESGVIYFGKNANGFSTAAYSKYLYKVDTLSNDTLALFHQILFYFFDICYCAPSVCAYYSTSLQKLSDLGLISISPCLEFVLRNYKNEALEREINQSNYLAGLWKLDKSNARKLCKDAGEAFTLRDYLIPWIKENAIDIIDSVADKYRIISIPADNRQYAIELYESRLRGNGSNDRLALPTDKELSFFATSKK